MPQSSVAWIDFAEQDRRRMVEVISLFRHRDTRDELGLGSVRYDLSTLSHHQPTRRIVRQREIWLKRGRSRFESRRHLEMWSSRAGLGRLDYRWPIARDITNDVLRGLKRKQEG